MTYRTILVHLNDKRRAEALLEPTIALARQHNAHLIGLHVYAAMPAPPITVPYAARALGAALSFDRKESEEIAAIFQRMTADQPFVSEWRSLKVPHVDLAAVVLDHGRAADLIVAGQTDPDWDLSPLLDFPERLALEGGRPVLVVPYAGRYPEVGRNVVVAWKATASLHEPRSMRCRFSCRPRRCRFSRSRKAAVATILRHWHPTPPLRLRSRVTASSPRCGPRLRPTSVSATRSCRASPMPARICW